MQTTFIRLFAIFVATLAMAATMPQRAAAADSGYRPGYDAIVTNIGVVVKNLENGVYDESFSIASPPHPASGGVGRTMIMTIPNAPKMSEDEIREMLAMMRKNSMPEAEVLRMESMLRTGTITVPMPSSPPGGGAPSVNIVPGDTPAMRDYRPVDPEANCRWAMKLGADMAVAAAYGFTTPDMIKTAGEAVKAFPHPLLLNNYGGMIMDLDPRQALFFFRAADAQQPENSLFLTNIASAFLELEDYAGAERYATMALRIDPMFGPAHVVMAVIHLKNKNMELAAESTVKAARNCFDANTEYLFKSLIEATDRFVWKGDSDMIYEPDKKFPLADEHMKILYEVAKSNVPSNEVNPDIDTPGAQVRIPPLQRVGSPENLISMEKYLLQETEKWMERSRTRDREDMKSQEKKRARGRGAAGYDRSVYAIDVSLRQKYAFMMVELYYKFQCAQAFEKSAVTIREPAAGKYREKAHALHKDWEKYVAEYNTQRQEMDAAYRTRKQELWDAYMVPASQLHGRATYGLLRQEISPKESDRLDAEADELAKQYNAQEKPLTEKYEADKCKMEMGFAEEQLKNNREQNTAGRNHVMETVANEERYYLELKQLLEEYWLKTGGIMKYVSDPLELALLNTRRESFVDAKLHLVTMALQRHSSDAKRILEPLENNYADLLGNMERARERCAKPPKPPRTVADAIATAMGGPGAAAEGERLSLSTFEEKDDYKLPVFGVEASVFEIGASVTADVENMKFTTSLGSPVGGVSAETDFASGNRTMVETLSGGPLSIFNVQADFEPLTPKTGLDRLKELAANKTALGTVVSKLTGPVSMSHEQGTYHTVDPTGRITDRGKVIIKSRGIGFDPLGISETTTINTSATGVTSKTTTRNTSSFSSRLKNKPVQAVPIRMFCCGGRSPCDEFSP